MTEELRANEVERTQAPPRLLAATSSVLVAALAFAAAVRRAGCRRDKWTVKLRHGGTFTLAKSIRDKVAKHESINYVFSYGSCSIQGFSQQYQAGYDASSRRRTRSTRSKGKRLCPPQTQQDVNTQINQIQALLNTNQVDCLSIEPQSSTSMAPLVAAGAEEGHSGLHRRPDDLRQRAHELHAGAAEGGADGGRDGPRYMKAHNLHFKTFAVSGGDPTQYWAQNRAKGFRRAIQKAIPGAKFVTTEKTMLNTTYDPGKTYDAYKAFLSRRRQERRRDRERRHRRRLSRRARSRTPAGPARRSASAGTSRPTRSRRSRTARRSRSSTRTGRSRPRSGRSRARHFMKSGKVLPNTQQLTVITKANLPVGPGEARRHQDVRAHGAAREARTREPTRRGGGAAGAGRPRLLRHD